MQPGVLLLSAQQFLLPMQLAANNAVYGGAIYVASGATLAINSAVFDGNGASNVSVSGGAVYVASGGCLNSITSSNFLGGYMSYLTSAD